MRSRGAVREHHSNSSLLTPHSSAEGGCGCGCGSNRVVTDRAVTEENKVITEGQNLTA